jgi:Zn-finger nucleic acid-binding protein
MGKRKQLTCTECKCRLAFCTAHIESFRPDQEPYESGVIEEIEGLNVDGEIDLCEPSLVYGFICPSCGKAYHVWLDEGETLNQLVARLNRELTAARSESRRLAMANKEVHDHLQRAMSVYATVTTVSS